MQVPLLLPQAPERGFCHLVDSWLRVDQVPLSVGRSTVASEEGWLHTRGQRVLAFVPPGQAVDRQRPLDLPAGPDFQRSWHRQLQPRVAKVPVVES